MMQVLLPLALFDLEFDSPTEKLAPISCLHLVRTNASQSEAPVFGVALLCLSGSEQTLESENWI